MDSKTFLYKGLMNQSNIHDIESDNMSIAADNILNNNLSNCSESNSDSGLIPISLIKTGESDIPYINRKPFFIVTYMKKKRGRQIINVAKKEMHLSSSPDNILSKIQIHFINFIINFSNDYIYAINRTNQCNFKNIISSFKAKISRKHFETTKNLTIKQIFERVDISVKYKKCNKDINKNTLQKLSNDARFQNLFDMKFMDLFHYYYNNGQPLNEICCSGIKIPLLGKTKTFHDLLEKNKDLKEDMFQIIRMFYLEDIQEI